GQTINKIELYSKLFGISDVMTLYISDPLTGILNRRGFEKRISEMFDQEGILVKPAAIVSIDMDGLKYINDTFGHKAGDEAIKETAKCINRALQNDEFVARMGGDEFSAILILSEPGRVGKFIRNIRNNIKHINDSGKYQFELSASIGTCDLTNWHEVMECMNKADRAMYLEKRAKKKNR
ncbi:MAG: GGDEF domain-containing protein, partial [Clostridiales bacterium]|nr:GGDEF domain-containing protein [Clostridiales bacterium]